MDILSQKYFHTEVTLFYPVHPLRGNICKLSVSQFNTIIFFITDAGTVTFHTYIILLPHKDPHCFFLSLDIYLYFSNFKLGDTYPECDAV